MSDRIIAIVQARLGSTRYPNKILQPINGQPALHLQIRRLQQTNLLHNIILAIPDLPGDDPLVDHARQLDIPYTRGHPTDLLHRYHHTLQTHPADHVVRITSDCPLNDPTTLNHTITTHLNNPTGWTQNDTTYPAGISYQICPTPILTQTHHTTTDPYDREHVFPAILRNHPGQQISHTSDLSMMRITLDHPEDLTVLNNIARHTDPLTCTLQDLEHLWHTQPDLFDANRHLMPRPGREIAT
jgi:glutamate-1-semialdehyde 2,1-aminomutase